MSMLIVIQQGICQYSSAGRLGLRAFQRHGQFRGMSSASSSKPVLPLPLNELFHYTETNFPERWGIDSWYLAAASLRALQNVVGYK